MSGQLLAVADQRAQFTDLLGCDPDTRQLADAFEVGQDVGVGEVGFVGRLLHAGDEAGVGEVDRPGEAVGEFFGEVGRSGAGFEGSTLDDAEASHGGVEGVGGIVHGSVAEPLAVRIEDAQLDVVLRVVESDEDW